MPRRRATASSSPPAPQLELFAEPVQVDSLDPQRAAGRRTRVLGAWLVRYGREPAPHRVFHDRHGWYCEVHGPRCRAVVAVHAARAAGSVRRALSGETIDMFGTRG